MQCNSIIILKIKQKLKAFTLQLITYMSIKSKVFLDINIGDEKQFEIDLKQFDFAQKLFEKVQSYAGFQSDSFDVKIY
jgi:hypothetical protein